MCLRTPARILDALIPPEQVYSCFTHFLFYPCSCIQLTQMSCLPRHYLHFRHSHIHDKCYGQEHLHFIQTPYGMPLEPVIPVYPSVDLFHSRPFLIQALPFMAAACHRREYPPVLSAFNTNPNKPEKFLQFLQISSTIKKNVRGCVHVTHG